MGGSSRWLRAACPREVVTDGFGLFMVLWPAVPGRRTLPAAPGWGAGPLAQDQQPGLVTMSSDPVAQGCTSQGPWAQGLAPKVELPHPLPAPALPLFLPPELGGPWGLTSLHRKRNRSHHLWLPQLAQ